MKSLGSIKLQLSCGLFNETMIPIQYLEYQNIIKLINQYNWSIGLYNTNGWVTLVKNINYSS